MDTYGPGQAKGNSAMAWVSWLNVGLGLWLVVAAFVFPHVSGGAVTENIVAGLFVALASLWAARAYNPLVSLVASWVVVLNGLWVAAAPFTLSYAVRRVSGANDVVVGLAIMALATTNMLAKGHRINDRSRAEQQL
jgi:hypothetical protein